MFSSLKTCKECTIANLQKTIFLTCSRYDQAKFLLLTVDDIKVTVHVGTDENIEIEIFAEYKYTLNMLLVTKIVFQNV